MDALMADWLQGQVDECRQVLWFSDLHNDPERLFETFEELSGDAMGESLAGMVSHAFATMARLCGREDLARRVMVEAASTPARLSLSLLGAAPSPAAIVEDTMRRLASERDALVELAAAVGGDELAAEVGGRLMVHSITRDGDVYGHVFPAAFLAYATQIGAMDTVVQALCDHASS